MKVSYRDLNLINLFTLRTTNRMFTSHGHKANHKFKFDEDILVNKDGKAFITDSWSVGDAPNGGYMMCIAINAARKHIHLRDPLVMTGYYFNKSVENCELDIDTKVLNSTKNTSTVQVQLSQEGQLKSQYIGTFGSHSSLKGPTHYTITAPNLDNRGDCYNASKIVRKHYGDNLKIAQRFEMRVPKNDHFATSTMPTLKSMALICDALPPPILNLHSSNWVPTMEYTVYFWNRPHATPADEAGLHWMRTKFETTVMNKGLLQTTGEVWSEDGRILLASSKQFAKLIIIKS